MEIFKKPVVFHTDLADCTRRLWSKGIFEAHWHLLENWDYVGRRKLYIKQVNTQTKTQKCTHEKINNYWWAQHSQEKGDDEKGVTIITTTQPTTDLPNFWLPFRKLWNKKSNNLNEDGKLLVRSSTNKNKLQTQYASVTTLSKERIHEYFILQKKFRIFTHTVNMITAAFNYNTFLKQIHHQYMKRDCSEIYVYYTVLKYS